MGEPGVGPGFFEGGGGWYLRVAESIGQLFPKSCYLRVKPFEPTGS